jgi:hypothetical protein
MVHDIELLDKLSSFATTKFDGQVFRAMGVSVNPIAPSINGGRWSPDPNAHTSVSVLYTSLEREGAIAEVASYISQLSLA